MKCISRVIAPPPKPSRRQNSPTAPYRWVESVFMLGYGSLACTTDPVLLRLPPDAWNHITVGKVLLCTRLTRV